MTAPPNYDNDTTTLSMASGTAEPAVAAPHSSPLGPGSQQQLAAECHGEEITDLHRDLWDLFASTAAAYPKHEAIVSMWQDPDESEPTEPGEDDADAAAAAATSSTSHVEAPSAAGDRGDRCLRWTYEELLSRSESLARSLQLRGCRPGTNLVASLYNCAEWALFLWAAAKARMVFVPIDPRVLAASPQYFLGATTPAVLVVHDGEAADALQAAAPGALEKAKVRICCADSQQHRVEEGWVSLSSLSDTVGGGGGDDNDGGPPPPLQHVAESPDEVESTATAAAEPTPTTAAQDAPPPPASAADQTALIIFTSGTTSTPKGCVATVANLWSGTHVFDPNPPGYFDRWLVHTPVSHIFAVNNALRAWRNGDTVVFASKSFEVASTLRALVQERCSVMSAVPALLKALMAQPSFPGHDALSLKYVTLGSTIITDADTRLAKHMFGADEAIQAFGMSEGAPIVSWTRKDPLLKDGHHAGVGKVLPGAKIRICEPGSRTPLLRNQVGELHIGGTSVIRGYLHGVGKDSFYDDESGNWLVSGDQAMIDDDGVLHMIGRYKDIIIRGGENIAPIKIEATIAQIPGVSAYVVGIEDPIAGQTPVAVVSMPESCTKADIAKKAYSLGHAYALSGVYTLAELGLQAPPLTITGKVRKEVLKEVLSKHLEKLASLEETVHVNGDETIDQDAPVSCDAPVNTVNKDDHEDEVALVSEVPTVSEAMPPTESPAVNGVAHVQEAALVDEDALATTDVQDGSDASTNEETFLSEDTYLGDEIPLSKDTPCSKCADLSADLPIVSDVVLHNDVSVNEHASNIDGDASIDGDAHANGDSHTIQEPHANEEPHINGVEHSLGAELLNGCADDTATAEVNGDVAAPKEGASDGQVNDNKDAPVNEEAYVNGEGVTTENANTSPPEAVKESPETQDSLETQDITAPQGSSPVETQANPKPQPSRKLGESALDVTIDKLCTIWESLVGIRPSPDANLQEFADSITVLRYCDRVLKTMGFRLYLQDFTAHQTLREQAQLLRARGHKQQPSSSSTRSLPNPESLFSTPQVSEKRPASSNGIIPQKAITSINIAENAPQTAFGYYTTVAQPVSGPVDLQNAPGFLASAAATLKVQGLELSDAEDALPIKDYFQQILAGERPQSYRHRMCFGVRKCNRQSVRRAIEIALTTRPILRTLLSRLPNGYLYHLVVRPCDTIFSKIITEYEVADADALRELLASDAAEDFPESLMTQIKIISLKGEISICTTYSHSVFDLLSIEPFQTDIDRLLLAGADTEMDQVVIPPLTPFKLFADLANMYQSSPPAQASVDYTVKRLRGISKFQPAIWPPQRAPGLMIAADSDSAHREERAAARSARWAESGEPWDERAAADFRFPRSSRVVNLRDMDAIRTQHRVDPSVVAKAALAVFNALQTGERYALFSTVEAARSWPFVPDWMASMLPPAMSVDGPTCEWVLHMPRVDVGAATGSETVGAFLARLAAEQDALAAHAHAPWFRVLDGLGPEEAAVAVEASRRQTFVWDVSMRFVGGSSEYGALKPVARYDWADCGLYWNCCMVDRTNLFVIASWDTAQMSNREVEGYCDGYADVLRRLADLGNWDKTLGEVFRQSRHVGAA